MIDGLWAYGAWGCKKHSLQQRVAGADNADEADDGAFVPGTTAEADGEDSGGYWWWQSTEIRAAKWAVPHWEVLAAGRAG
jgi:hypothetical protein